MLFERFEDPLLSQYSYMVGCRQTGKAAIVDPRRDFDVYLTAAGERGLEITCVLETHIHADFASGARALADRCGAAIALSSYDEGEKYEIDYPHQELVDGDSVEIGTARLRVLHTPGHTPEHVSFLATDDGPDDESDSPAGRLLSGDFLFVGSVGRPDLLGEDAKRDLARSLFRSVTEKLPDLPDEVEVHPGHGAGSMCGSGMSGRASSTLGQERISNPYLDPSLDEDGFVERILAAAPPLPPYYLRMKALNASGAPPLASDPAGRAIPPDSFRQLWESGHTVIDLRSPAEFGAGHVPGAFGIGLRGNFTTWAAWVVPYEKPILLVAPDEQAAAGAGILLARVGLDDVAGHLEGGFDAWRQAGHPMTQTGQLPVGELHQKLARGNGPAVLDVRGDSEWRSGHIPGATHIMGGFLNERLDEVPAGKGGVAVVCGSGYRSTVAASVLERAGVEPVYNVPGGMGAWRQAGLPWTTSATP